MKTRVFLLYLLSATRIVNASGRIGTRRSDFDLVLARKRLGAEQLVKLLEVKTVNATAMKLFWRVRLF